MNARTKETADSYSGGSALWWAINFHGEDHEIVQSLRSKGAKNFGPGDKDEL